jgi:DNA repair photolyase
MEQFPLPIHGRGTVANPPNPFERLAYEPDPDTGVGDRPAPATQFFRDASRSIITYNDSPDIPFSASINPYRGCEHGCSYCYARPYHEYLGLSSGLDFETKIFVKEDAPELLRKELSAKSWQPQFLSVSGVTDAYQPIERQLQLTRRCLQVLAEFRNPASIVTKNHLVCRDIDVLRELAKYQAMAVFISLTTLDGELKKTMEPRASHPEARLAAIEELSRAGIPTGVMVAPIIPGLNDHEMPALLEAAAGAGARHAGYVPLRLPHALADLFEQWLAQHYPDHKDKVLGRIRELRGGKLNEADFGKRMRGEGPLADMIKQVFRNTCRRLGLNRDNLELSTEAFRRPEERSLFDDLEN